MKCTNANSGQGNIQVSNLGRKTEYSLRVHLNRPLSHCSAGWTIEQSRIRLHHGIGLYDANLNIIGSIQSLGDPKMCMILRILHFFAF